MTFVMAQNAGAHIGARAGGSYHRFAFIYDDGDTTEPGLQLYTGGLLDGSIIGHGKVTGSDPRSIIKYHHIYFSPCRVYISAVRAE